MMDPRLREVILLGKDAIMINTRPFMVSLMALEWQWSPYSVGSLLVSGLIAVAGLLLAMKYAHEKRNRINARGRFPEGPRNKVPGYLIIYFVMGLCLYFFRGISYLFLLEWLYRLTQVPISIAILAFLFWIEQMKKEEVSGIKVVVYTLIAGMAIGFAWIDSSVITRESMGITVFSWYGAWEIGAALLVVIMAVEATILAVSLFRRAPNKFKRPIFVLVVGIIALGVAILLEPVLEMVDAVFIEFQESTIWALDWAKSLAVMVGAVVNGYIFFLPGIRWILPFKIYRLVVIRADNGIAVYDHQWQETEIDESLLGGLLNALSDLSKEVLSMGEIDRMRLDLGWLLIQRGDRVVVGLVTSKASSYLLGRLRVFTSSFEKVFKKELSGMQGPVSAYENAEEILQHAFPGSFKKSE